MRVALMLLIVTFAGCIGGSPSEPQLEATIEVELQWTPQFPEVRDTVSFAAIISGTVEPTILSSEWRLDGKTYSGTETPHQFFIPGTYPVTFILTTEEFGTETYQDFVTVIGVGEEPPAPEPEEDETPPEPTPGAPLAIEFAVQEATVSFTYAWDETPDLIKWDFGDGASSTDPSPTHRYGAAGTYTVKLAASSAQTAVANAQVDVTIVSVPFEEHVIVAIPDSGANPYHEAFYRPERTGHPCEYVEDFPCDVETLPLSVGRGLSYSDAVRADEALWSAMKPGKFYWIPKTNFVAFGCEVGHDGKCGLDDADTHGTGTTGSVVTEEPDVLLAFKEGGSGISMFASKKIPVDIFSVSWGWAVPEVGLSAPMPLCGDTAPIYVKSSGNTPGLTTLPDCWTSHPDVMSIGGAYAQDDSQSLQSGKEPDFVSYFCRPAAAAGKITGTSNWCGTSFAAPTAAGAMAKALLALRRDSGYKGSLQDGKVDAIADVSVQDFREALQLTASYDPEPSYSNTNVLSAPLNPVAPCMQWGWGFLDGKVADATIDHLLGIKEGSKDAICTTYMETLYLYRETVNDRNWP